MTATRPRYSKEEFARRGDAIYERDIRSAIEAGNQGKFVAIDIETGAYEVDADEQVASDRLVTRVPGAQVWLRRVGSRYVRRFGGRARTVPPLLSPRSCNPELLRCVPWFHRSEPMATCPKASTFVAKPRPHSVSEEEAGGAED